MKKFVVVLAMVGCVVGFATSALAAIEVEGDVYAGVYDKYMWRGFNLSGSQPVLQAGMDVSFSGLTVSYWTNTQLSKSTQEEWLLADETTETDIVLDYSFDVGELLSVSVGDIQYNFNTTGNTHEVYLAMGLNTLLAPSLTVYYDWDASQGYEDSDTGDISDVNGAYYSLAIGHDIELPAGLGLSVGAAVNYNDESPFVGIYDAWHNYELSAGLSYAVTEQISVDASVIYSDAISDIAEKALGKDGESTGGVNVTLAF